MVTVTKSAHNRGERPSTKDFELSQSAIKDLFAILSTFYNYLLQEEYVQMNPVALIRQKSKFIRKFQGQQKIRRLSELQWSYVIETAKKMASEDPENHEKTLFIMSALYSMPRCIGYGIPASLMMLSTDLENTLETMQGMAQVPLQISILISN